VLFGVCDAFDWWVFSRLRLFGNTFRSFIGVSDVQAIELLDQWATIDIACALELLNSYFDNPLVRKFGVKTLSRADDEVLIPFCVRAQNPFCFLCSTCERHNHCSLQTFFLTLCVYVIIVDLAVGDP
jgi:hypothetical protein